MSIIDIYKYITVLATALWGAVVDTVSYILNANILFLISVSVVLVFAKLLLNVYHNILSGHKKKFPMDPNGASDTMLALFSVMVYIIGFTLVIGFLAYIEEFFKVL